MTTALYYLSLPLHNYAANGPIQSDCSKAIAGLELTVESRIACIVWDKLWVAELMASRAAISAANLVA